MAPNFEGPFRDRGHLPGNDFAIPYVSRHTCTHDSDKGLLNFVNCSYLSTPGRAPTLEQLKRHAQSLCILIAQLSVTTKFSSIARGSGVMPEYDQNDAYDWLHDLRQPYTNSDETHQEPLNSLLNEAKLHHETLGTDYHCPLVEMKPHVRKKGQARMPYASHQNLIMHANSCLEFLDHEYGATGGLLSILPTDEDHDTEELKAAKNTILGQWLRYTQHLVGRMHELEIAYGNALDALGGEAAIPAQIMAHQGPDGSSSARPTVQGQDKWILANAGPDVLSYIHRQLDRVEAQIDQKEAIWRNSGVTGSRTWMEERGGDTYAKGIVPVNITTRYYRLRGEAGKGSPIFVLPAWEHHPAVEHTRELEKRPTVVSVVTPQWPERVSEFMNRHQERLKQASETEVKYHDTMSLLTASQTDITILQRELERERCRSEYAEAHIMEISSKSKTIEGETDDSIDNMPQNPLPLKIDNDYLRSNIEAHQEREADYRATINKLQARVGELEATIKMGTLTMTDAERIKYEEVHKKVMAYHEDMEREEKGFKESQMPFGATGSDTPSLEGTGDVAEREQKRKTRGKSQKDIDMAGA